MKNNWERLCNSVNYYTIKNHNSGMNERDFECHFREYLQNIFGWYQDDEEVRRQFPVYFGHEKVKYADIGIEPEERHRNVYYCYSRWTEMYPENISLLELSHIEHFALSEDLGRKFMLEELGYSQEETTSKEDWLQ